MTRSKYALPIAAILTLLFSAMLSLSSAAEPLEPQLAPIALYGKEILFDVERTGKTVGYHRTEFKVTDGELFVRNTFHVEIKIFFIILWKLSKSQKKILSKFIKGLILGREKIYMNMN